MQKKESYYGTFYRRANNPVKAAEVSLNNPQQSTQGLEQLGSILARSIFPSSSAEISETEGGAR